MITHRYHDGTEGYEYELGDVVTIKDAIGGDGAFSSFFLRGVGKDGPVVRLEPYNRRNPSRHTMMLHVKDSPEWGPSQCYPWMVEPTAETRAKATIRIVQLDDVTDGADQTLSTGGARHD